MPSALPQNDALRWYAITVALFVPLGLPTWLLLPPESLVTATMMPVAVALAFLGGRWLVFHDGLAVLGSTLDGGREH
jgi:hypothetical protein